MLELWRERLNARSQRQRNRARERQDRYVDRRLGLMPTRGCYRGAKATYIGDGTLLCWTQGRYYLYVSARDVNLTPALANFGRVSPWLSRVIAQTVRPGMTVADIGANVGYFTMLLADLVGPAGRVHAFEPNGDLAKLIWRSAQANHLDRSLTIHSHALGSVDGGEAWLCIAGEALAGGAVHDAPWVAAWTEERGPGDTDRDPTGGRKASAVRVERLDTLPDARTIAFAKIDVEGFEPEVWAGMADVLAHDALRTVVLEYTPGHYRDAPAFAEALFAPGWTVAIIDPIDGPSPIARERVLSLAIDGTYDLLLTR